MNCFQLTLLILIQISSVLTMSGSGVFTSTTSSGDYSGEQSSIITTTSPPSSTLFSCPCSRYLVVSVVGYSPCATGQLLSPRECDPFIQVALRRAFSSLFSKVELPLFNNYCFWPFPFNEDEADLPHTIGLPSFYRNSPPLHMHGIIGPPDIYVSEIFSYISAMTIKKLSVSYSTSDSLLEDHDKYPFFFATSTKPSSINIARLKLLSDFDWRRVAVVATDDLQNSKSAEKFVKQAQTNLSLDIKFPGTFHDDPTVLLQDYKNDDYRIFMGFFGSHVSREIICKAYKLGLTTHNHVWILPGIYDYRWWRTCSCDSRSKCGCECTEEEMNEAIQGMIFIDTSHLHHFESETYSIQEQYDKLEAIYKMAVNKYIFIGANITEEDEQYLIHSQAFNAYDAALVWANVFHKAVEQLLNSSLFNDRDSFCEYLITPVDWLSDEKDILNEIMMEILEESVFCGNSGFYTFSKQYDADNFVQVMITQFQNDQECYIGIYKNYNPSDSECVLEELQPLRQSLYLNSSSSLVFVNYTEFNITDSNFSYPCPYRWKGENGTLVSWKPPTDGACYDESCLCYNQLGVLEIAITYVIVAIGIIVSIVLLIFNVVMRSNKHIKASSPKFNVLVIVGSLVMYPAALFTALSYSGTLIENVNIRQKAIPAFSEIRKWLLGIGTVTILSVMFIRNWRIYKIFSNPKIKERKFLSDKSLGLIITCLIIPVVLLLIIWTGVHPYKYDESKKQYDCPNIIVDDSIKTYLVTITGSTEKWWNGILVGYNFLLSFGLIFLSYQNTKIPTHFVQEGEFAARVVFVIFLFLVPSFVIKILLLLTSDNIILIFWLDLIFIVGFPTVILGGLFIPKFIMIRKDKKVLRKQKTLRELGVVHTKQKEQITSLRSTLEKRQSSIITLRQGSVSSMSPSSFTKLDSPDDRFFHSHLLMIKHSLTGIEEQGTSHVSSDNSVSVDNTFL